jgi:hypothetical protein
MTAPERSFARVETTLKAHVRRLGPGRFTPLFGGPQTPAPTLSEAAQPGLPDGLVQFLCSMNEKLDSILTLLNLQRLQEDFPVPALVHDISGAGVRFSSPERFEVGQDVEMVIVLGGQPQILAGAMGAVLREEEYLGQTVWALGFQEMRDSEREKIIQYVVARQREELRERHLAPSS